MRSRSGTATGSARAAASEITPRIPAHAMIVTLRHGGEGSRSLIERNAKRGRYVAGKTHAMRTKITAKLTIAA